MPTDSKHSPEPWPAFGPVCDEEDSANITRTDMRRAAACVNACKGIVDPAAAIKGVRQLLKAWRRDIECPEDREQIETALRALGA